MFGLMLLTYASSAFVPVRTMPWWLHDQRELVGTHA
jgi:hypothetical protein